MRHGRVLIFRLLVILIAGFCPWVAAVRAQVTPTERVFSGTVNYKYRIQMRLRRAGKTLSGSYFYERVQQALTLRGEIDAQNNFILREYNSSGAQTGIFKGKWEPADCEGCGDSLNGNWSRPDGKGSLMFDLTVYAVDFRGPLKLMTRSMSEKGPKPPPQYEISLEYPQIEGSASANVARFNELIRGKASQVASQYRADFLDRHDESDFGLTYVVGLANDDLVSVDLISCFHYDGAAQRWCYPNTINYDLKSGRLIRFEELFRPGVDYLKWFTDYSLRDLKRQFKDRRVNDKQLQEGLNEMLGNEDRWLVTPEGLDLVFDSLNPSPVAVGEAHVIVPYSEMKQIIRSDGPLSAFTR